MARLYEIAERYRALEALLEDEYVDNSMLMDALSEVDDEFNDKVKNITHLLKDSEYHCNYLKLEEERLNKKRKSLEKKIENLKMYIDANMKLRGTKKVDVGTFTITVRKNPLKVEVVEITDIPSRFIKTKTEFTVDKKAILESIKSGEEVDGVKLVQTESLLIR